MRLRPSCCGRADGAEMQADLDKVAPRLKAHAPELHDVIVAHVTPSPAGPA